MVHNSVNTLKTNESCTVSGRMLEYVHKSYVQFKKIWQMYTSMKKHNPNKTENTVALQSSLTAFPSSQPLPTSNWSPISITTA